MEFKDIKQIEKAQSFNQKDGVKLFIVLIFFLVISLVAIMAHTGHSTLLLVFATIIGGYMAMNIGANDVANNVGPAVGSHAITLVCSLNACCPCFWCGLVTFGNGYWRTCFHNTFTCRWNLGSRDCCRWL